MTPIDSCLASGPQNMEHVQQYGWVSKSRTCRLDNLSWHCRRKISKNSVCAKEATKRTIVCRSGHLHRHTAVRQGLCARGGD